MRDKIISWLMQHAHEYTSAVSLAVDAIGRFNLDAEDVEDRDNWIWDEAQIAFDTRKEGTLKTKYA